MPCCCVLLDSEEEGWGLLSLVLGDVLLPFVLFCGDCEMFLAFCEVFFVLCVVWGLALPFCCTSVVVTPTVLLDEAEGEVLLSPAEDGGCIAVLPSPWPVFED